MIINGIKSHITELKFAFPYTLPICAAYTFLGIAVGILMNEKGFPFYVTTFMSIFIFGGAMQMVAISILTTRFDPLNTIIITLMVQARYLFYSIASLEDFKKLPLPQMIYRTFGLVDETFAVNYQTKVPEDLDANVVHLFVTILDQFYWIFGTTLGALLGPYLHINTKGLDFVMTATFVSVFVEQWTNSKNHMIQIVGIVVPTLCILLFNKNNFMIPTMLIILLFLYIYKHHMDKYNNKETIK